MNTNVRHSIRVDLCSFVVPGPESSLQLADTQKTVQSEKINTRRLAAHKSSGIQTDSQGLDGVNPLLPACHQRLHPASGSLLRPDHFDAALKM